MAAHPVKGASAISIDDADYHRFRGLISARTGLDFPENKRVDLEAGLRRALAQSSYQDLTSYYVSLTDEVRGSLEFERLVAHLTVAETYFFRNSAQLVALREEILPRLIGANQASRRLRIWSAGCASGEEPYSVAMVLREILPDIDNWTILILGTDIDRKLLSAAERARYGPWSFRGCPPEITARYFTHQGEAFHLRPEIRKMVTFARHNLVEDPYPPPAGGPGGMDLILCRNVTIYFDSSTTQRVVDRFYDSLFEGGWLIVGHAEPSLEIYRRFRVKNFPDTIAYQKAPPEQPTSAPDLRPAPLELSLTPPDFTNHAPLVDRAVQPAAPADKTPVAHSRQADDAYRQAREHTDRGRLDDARRLLEEALAADLLQPRAHYLMGLIYQEQGMWEPSLEALRRAIFLDRAFVLAHVALASVALRTGKVVQARRSLETAHKLLRKKPRDELVPDADGLTVGRLLDAVVMQLQTG